MNQRAASTELTGGAGFKYEDTVVAYYLAALLREERAAPLNAIVKTVAVQQAGHDDPMDDVIIEFDDAGSLRKMGLQGKSTITISAAESNAQFRDIMSRALATRSKVDFQNGLDAYGFFGENIAVDPFYSGNIARILWGGTFSALQTNIKSPTFSLRSPVSYLETNDWGFLRRAAMSI